MCRDIGQVRRSAACRYRGGQLLYDLRTHCADLMTARSCWRCPRWLQPQAIFGPESIRSIGLTKRMYYLAQRLLLDGYIIQEETGPDRSVDCRCRALGR